MKKEIINRFNKEDVRYAVVDSENKIIADSSNYLVCHSKEELKEAIDEFNLTDVKIKKVVLTTEETEHFCYVLLKETDNKIHSIYEEYDYCVLESFYNTDVSDEYIRQMIDDEDDTLVITAYLKVC